MRTTSKAFTLIELLVVLAVAGLLVGVTASTYSLFRRSMGLDQGKAALAQNGRIAIDRLSRELRQTPELVTPIPENPADTSIPQPGELEFEDGHANDLTYKRYYIDNGVLKVDIKQYYFAYDSGNRVKWNAAGTSGQAPVSSTISTNDVADSVGEMQFYGLNQVQVLLTMEDTDNQSLQLRTVILGRNL